MNWKLFSIISCALILFSFPLGSEGFGYLAHRAISEVAQSLLTKGADEAVRHYLGNLTLAQIVIMPDEYRDRSGGAWSGNDFPPKKTTFPLTTKIIEFFEVLFTMFSFPNQQQGTSLVIGDFSFSEFYMIFLRV